MQGKVQIKDSDLILAKLGLAAAMLKLCSNTTKNLTGNPAHWLR
jgi:hypothetical protein